VILVMSRSSAGSRNCAGRSSSEFKSRFRPSPQAVVPAALVL
jgi:hypothetical protein